MRRRSQTDDLRTERYAAIVPVMGDMVERNLDGHFGFA
jgi:hypothetical protein